MLYLFQCGITNKPNTSTSYPKLRRGIKSQPFDRVTGTTIISNPTRCSQPKRPNEKSPTGSSNYPTKMPNNIMKHFASDIVHNSSQSQVIQNYLNQTIPMVLRSGNVINGSNIVHQINKNDINEIIGTVTRSQTNKNHIRHNTIHKLATTKTLHPMNNYSQNHGVITATAYENLRNGTIIG